jgi:hypothetical protein
LPAVAPAALANERTKAPSGNAGKPDTGSTDTLSDARDPLIKDKPASIQLSNHNSGIGNTSDSVAGPGAATTLSPEDAAPLENESAAAVSVRSAMQLILAQPGVALLAQANVSSLRAQQILS